MNKLELRQIIREELRNILKENLKGMHKDSIENIEKLENFLWSESQRILFKIYFIDKGPALTSSSKLKVYDKIWKTISTLRLRVKYEFRTPMGTLEKHNWADAIVAASDFDKAKKYLEKKFKRFIK